eukprot:g5264.t1
MMVRVPMAFQAASAACCAAGVLAVYAKTLYPSIPGGDSGELVAEACHLGVAHPPGYPTFTMLVHAVVAYLPGGPPAWKSNLFCALCGSLAAAFIQMSVQLWAPASAGVSWGSFVAAGLFAFSPLVWEYSVGSEVFALNNAAAAAVVCMALLYARARRWSDALRGALLCGFALTNQHTIVLFVVPVVAWVLWTERRELTGRRFTQLCASFICGLLPYAYLVWAANTNPQPGSWGDTGTLAGFVHHLRRGDYGTFRLFSSDGPAEGLGERLAAYADNLVSQQSSVGVAVVAVVGLARTLWLGAPPAPAGAPALQRKERKPATAGAGAGVVETPPRAGGAALILLGMYSFYLLVFHSLANLPLKEGLLFGVHMRFWMQPNAIFFVWVGVGFDFVASSLLTSRQARPWRPAVAAAVAAAVVAARLHASFAHADQSDNFHLRNYARAILAPMPPNALLLTNYDQQWTSIRYLQRCEHYRRDVHVLQLSMASFKWFGKRQRLYDALTFPGTHLVGEGSAAHRAGGFTLQEFVQANYGHVSAVYMGGQALYNDPSFTAAIETVPAGLVSQLVPRSRMPPFDAWAASADRAWEVLTAEIPALPTKERYDDRTWEWTVARDYYMQQSARATYLLEKTIQKNSSLPLLAKSARLLEEVIVGQAGCGKAFLPSHTWKNLGLAYAHMVRNTAENFPPGAGDPLSPLAGGDPAVSWRERATARFIESWSTFLQQD